MYFFIVNPDTESFNIIRTLVFNLQTVFQSVYRHFHKNCTFNQFQMPTAHYRIETQTQ